MSIGVGVSPFLGSSDFTFSASEAPSDLTATTYSDTRIDLTCTDNSGREDGFSWEYSDDNGLTYSEHGTTLANDTTYSATGLTAGTLYYFRCRAFKGIIYSDYSNVASAGTIEEKAYAVLDTLADGKYNIFSSLAQNPITRDTVIMTYLQGVSPNYDATKVLQMRVSSDRGQTFGVASTIYDPGGVYCVQEKHMAYTSDGRLHILCTIIDNATPGVPSLIYLYSDDDGANFTVEDITAVVYDATYVVWRNSGSLVENNGVLLTGFYSFDNPATSYRKYCLRLVNGTWTKALIETTAANETECAIESLTGNNLIMLVRDDVTDDFIQYSSADNGLTWTRLGVLALGITVSAGLPCKLRKFSMHGEYVIVLYAPRHGTPFYLYAFYATATDLVNNGITGWNLWTRKIVKTAAASHYIFHGDCLHYNSNYQAIGCWPEVVSTFADSDIITFEVDSTDYDALWALLFPTAYETDADATAFNTAAGITVPSQQTAINNLTGALKGIGIWTKLKALYPVIGSTVATHKWNLKDPRDLDAAFRLTFGGGWTHGATGMTPNGTTGYADTHISALNDLTLYSVTLGYYSRTNVSEAGIDIGAFKTLGITNPCLLLRVRYTDGKGRHYSYNGYGAADAAVGDVVADSRGLTMGSRTANNVNKLFINGVQSGVTTTNVAIATTTTYTIYIGSSNSDGVAASFVTKECAMAIIASGFTDQELRWFFKVNYNYQTALSRNV